MHKRLFFVRQWSITVHSILFSAVSLHHLQKHWYVFPDSWKSHLITPIPKSGDRSLVCNYRPISLLPVVSKVMESLVYEKIIDDRSYHLCSLVSYLSAPAPHSC